MMKPVSCSFATLHCWYSFRLHLWLRAASAFASKTVTRPQTKRANTARLSCARHISENLLFSVKWLWLWQSQSGSKEQRISFSQFQTKSVSKMGRSSAGVRRCLLLSFHLPLLISGFVLGKQKMSAQQLLVRRECLSFPADMGRIPTQTPCGVIKLHSSWIFPPLCVVYYSKIWKQE